MNNETSNNKAIEFGSLEFWEFYDRFVTTDSLVRLIEEPDYPLATQMHEITQVAHRARTIHSLSRPERGWKHHNAWLSLRHAEIQNSEGRVVTHMRPGDVIVVEHGWDRDVIITHCPIPRNIVCGYLLSGRWEPMIGLFLPLFDRETILNCVQLMATENAKESNELALEEARDWHWP